MGEMQRDFLLRAFVLPVFGGGDLTSEGYMPAVGFGKADCEYNFKELYGAGICELSTFGG